MGLKILWVGDSPTVNTGFGVVSDNILKRLYQKKYVIGVLGVNQFGEPYSPAKHPFPIWSGEKGSMEEVYGMRKLWAIVKEFKPDLLFFLNDPWIINDYLQFKPDDLNPKIIAYYPIDGGPIKKRWVDRLNSLDAQICYSEYGKTVMKESNGGALPENLYQVYHGVDQEVFHPVNQSEARLELGFPTDAFIVGMVARNQYRKRFDLLMEAFAIFAKDKPEAKLYLHTVDHDIGYDLGDIAKQFDIQKKVILPEDIIPPKGVPAPVLNLVYNSLDIHVLLSLGDGFGLPVAESMRTGVPQLVSDHSCLKELVDGHGGEVVKTAAWIANTAGINTWGGVSDVNDTVEKLNKLYWDKDLRMKHAQEGYDFISQEIFSWDYVANRMDDIIKNVFHVIHQLPV